MAIQVTTLFICDAQGHLVRVNESGGEPADRFFLGRTRSGNLWRWRHDLLPGLARELERLACTEPVTADFASEPAIAEAVRALLRQHAPIEGEWRGPAYYVPDGVRPPPAIRVVAVTDANAAVLRMGFPYLFTHLREVQPCVAVLEQGSAVSVCFSARTSSHAAEAGVETLEPFRGKGYGSAVVAGWASAVRGRGKLPLYSTSWDNAASQGLARKLGLVLYGEDFHIS